MFELAEWVEVELSTRQLSQPRLDSDTFVLGRNFAMFELLRKWSYVEIRNFWEPNGQEAWRNTCRAKIDEIWDKESINWGLKDHCYDANERKATAKSVADWTWSKFTPATFRGLIERTHRPAEQQARNKKSVKVRQRARDLKRSQALAMREQGLTKKVIAAKLNLSLRTIQRHFNY